MASFRVIGTLKMPNYAGLLQLLLHYRRITKLCRCFTSRPDNIKQNGERLIAWRNSYYLAFNIFVYLLIVLEKNFIFMVFWLFTLLTSFRSFCMEYETMENLHLH